MNPHAESLRNVKRDLRIQRVCLAFCVLWLVLVLAILWAGCVSTETVIPPVQPPPKLPDYSSTGKPDAGIIGLTNGGYEVTLELLAKYKAYLKIYNTNHPQTPLEVNSEWRQGTTTGWLSPLAMTWYAQWVSQERSGIPF